jgi:hypothetical protein
LDNLDINAKESGEKLTPT